MKCFSFVGVQVLSSPFFYFTKRTTRRTKEIAVQAVVRRHSSKRCKKLLTKQRKQGSRASLFFSSSPPCRRARQRMNLLLLFHCLPERKQSATLFSFDEFNFLVFFHMSKGMKINKPTVTAFYTRGQQTKQGSRREKQLKSKKPRKKTKDLNNFFICWISLFTWNLILFLIILGGGGFGDCVTFWDFMIDLLVYHKYKFYLKFFFFHK